MCTLASAHGTSLPSYQMTPSILSNETPMASLPEWAQVAPFDRFGLLPSPARPQGHAFAECRSPVCLAKCHSTFAPSFTLQPLLPSLALSGCPKRRHARNDLMFRRGWQFCNIEPKICQH